MILREEVTIKIQLKMRKKHFLVSGSVFGLAEDETYLQATSLRRYYPKIRF